MKDALRQQMKLRRAAQDPAEAAAASIAAQDRLIAMPAFTRAKRVACYLSAPGEVGTDRILHACFAAGQSVVVPARRGAASEYAWCRLTPETVLRTGPFDIREPGRPEWTSAGEVDFAVVPGVAFDPAGRRLGHGMGIYDRLLAGEPGAFKAGLAFEWQLAREVPAGHRDVTLDAVVTERTIYGSGGRAETRPASAPALKNTKNRKGERVPS